MVKVNGGKVENYSRIKDQTGRGCHWDRVMCERLGRSTLRVCKCITWIQKSWDPVNILYMALMMFEGVVILGER